MRTKVLAIAVAMGVCGFLLSSGAFAGEQDVGESEAGSKFQWFSLIQPLGIATLSVVALTVLTGLLRKKLRRKFLKIHLPLAIGALALGLSHGLLVFILYR